jgi:hypothetical protein
LFLKGLESVHVDTALGGAGHSNTFGLFTAEIGNPLTLDGSSDFVFLVSASKWDSLVGALIKS